MLKQLLALFKPRAGTPNPARYADERAQATSPHAGKRLALAKNPHTHPEILYFLADDADHYVRVAVARNASTPLQASPRIARDKHVDVRLALARRLMQLLPELSQEQHSQLYAFAAQALGILALDEVLKVRLSLSSVLKDMACAPPAVVLALARDIEREVAAPVLQACLALPDHDLLDILASHPQPWVVQAIAKRPHVSASVASAIIQSGDVEAGGLLLRNDGAMLDDTVLEQIVEAARLLPEWHKPLVVRKYLPREIIREIMTFIDQSLHHFILKRTDLDPETRADVEETVKRRVRFLVDTTGKPMNGPQKLEAAIKSGRIAQSDMVDALALREHEFVRGGLAFLAQIPRPVVDRILNTKAPKPVTALVWKAGLPMRFAFDLQKELVKVPHSELLYPRNGTDFPLSEDDMRWQLNFFHN